MRKTLLFIILFIILVLALFFLPEQKSENSPSKPKVRSTSSPFASIEMKKARDDFFFKMLRDPETNRIPENIRRKELQFAENIKNISSLQKTLALQWQEAGPNDVGGRTRALAIDITNPNTIIAGGISGGIWKSTNKGQTWSLKSSTIQVLSVTSLAQDPRPGQTNNWYYTTGEFGANSAGDQGYTATFSGGGVYKSTDNGDTWNLLESTSSPDPTKWDGNFDFASKVIVSPTTGSVFVATNAIGIFKSANAGGNFNLVLGNVNEHIFNDVIVGSNGTLIAAISRAFQGTTPKNSPGIYKSVDDGVNWTNITPVSFPNTAERTMLALAPSNENVLYVYTNSGAKNGDKENVKFYRINLTNGSAEDRSANLPDFGNNYNDFINTQGNYNMVLAVQPNNENIVVLGASSLFRSLDGFASKPNEVRLGLIGGYYPESPWRYPNLHPDIHSFAFDPQNPSAMWCGHDGGLSYTTDISNTAYNKYLPWENKNNRYNVTQFYMITIPDKPGDNRIMGGCQDNGTPYFTFDGNTTSSSEDVGGGDGAFAYFGNDFAYVSSQSGFIIRLNYDNEGNPKQASGWSVIHPKTAQNQLFINPYAVDPNAENVMYYPAGNVLWRNSQLNNIPYYESEGTTVGWNQMSGINIPSGYLISTLSISKNPAHVLYFAITDYQNTPKIYRLDKAAVSNGPATEISIPGVPAGAYVHNIAVNPDNANEILVVLSNYNIVGLYHSTSGGQSYNAVEGNLTGTQQNPGPSLRAATILPSDNGTNYFVATSIGVFSTTQLAGGNTAWSQEGANSLGNVVVNSIASRKSDGKVVAGTHGRGAFVASLSGGTGNAIASVNLQSLAISVKPGESSYSGFTLSNTGSANLTYNITTSGKNDSPAKSDGIMKVYKVPKKGTITGFGEANSEILRKSNTKPLGPVRNPEEISGDDFLVIDDGSNLPDTYLGYGGADFGWGNEFNPLQNFSMDSFFFYMNTDVATTNKVALAVLNENLGVISEATLNLPLAATGDWYKITFDTPIEFSAGSKFYIVLQTKTSGILYPAGMDNQAQVTDKSYYLNGTSLVNLNTTQYEDGGFLIRASGTLGGTANQPPNAVAQLSKLSAKVNESITFDASQSSDPDGTIAGYQWNFGDGTSSNDITVVHSYSQANTYNIVLTVVDDKGATATSSGQVVISDNTVGKRLTVSPESGSVSPGSSVDVFVTYNASGLVEGIYQEQITISSNGGNITLPVVITVSNAVDVKKEEGIPATYFVDQNFPNPFNPSTQIRYGLPAAANVLIKVYDTNGMEIAELLNEQQQAGTYKLFWNGRNSFGNQAASGIYLYSIRAGSFTETRKMILLK